MRDELDPYLAEAHTTLAWILHWSHRHEDAIVEFNQRVGVIAEVAAVLRPAMHSSVICASVQPFCEKYFAFRFARNSNRAAIVSHPNEGRFAIVTDVGRGMRWMPQLQKASEAVAYGKTGWS